FSLVEGWKPVGWSDIALLSLAAAFVIGGYYLIVDAMRHGALSVVGPFRYTALIWALLSGYLVWGDVPNLLAVSGIAVIVGSGLYVLHRERVGR
ncbi:MAG: EamA/RhaT family transporter, partial [Ferrovibrionaceae bacterium]